MRKPTHIRRAEHRSAWLAANGPCAHCGSSERLEVDHVNPSTKDPRLMGKGNSARLWDWTAEGRAAELAKCQALCRSCHASKSSSERGGWKHGTRYAHDDKGCRCTECRAFVAAKSRKRRAR